MGASNNKPLRSTPPERRARIIPRNLWRRRNESRVNDLNSVEYVSRYNNSQNDNIESTSSWDNQQYYNEQNYDNTTDNNPQADFFAYQEEHPQHPDTTYNQDSILLGNETNTDRSYLNHNLIDYRPQSRSDYNFVSTRSDGGNYNFGMSARPILRRHSLNNDIERAQFYQNNNILQVHSYSLNNINSGMYYQERSSPFGFTSYSSDSNVFKTSNPDSWRDSGRERRYNSVHGLNKAGIVGGKKRNSLDEDFYGSGSDVYRPEQVSTTYDSNPNIATHIGPRVKRRQTCDSYDKRSDSALSYYKEASSSDNNPTELPHDNLDSNHDVDERINVLNILKFPSVWSSYSMTRTGFTDIPSSTLEGEKLRRFFHKTSNTKDFKLFIRSIARIENPFLHTLYLLKKEELMLRNGHVDELHLFHGTKEENLSKICEENLNWRLFSEKHRFGKGVAFSPLASYSSHYCDNTELKVMLIFKVLVSNADSGTSEMDIPPIIDGITYDTSVKEDISVIVKYSDNEFYPLYKIIFTKRKC